MCILETIALLNNTNETDKLNRYLQLGSLNSNCSFSKNRLIASDLQVTTECIGIYIQLSSRIRNCLIATNYLVPNSNSSSISK